MPDNIEKLIKETVKDTKKYFDEKTAEIKSYVDEKAVETQGHFEAVAEDMRSDFRAVIEHIDGVEEKLNSRIDSLSEQVAINTEKTTEIQETLDGHGHKLDSIEDTLSVVQDDVRDTNYVVKPLEKRVSTLEKKVN